MFPHSFASDFLDYLADFLPMEWMLMRAILRERVASPSPRYFSTMSFFLQAREGVTVLYTGILNNVIFISREGFPFCK
jgi:hypothetical protein